MSDKGNPDDGELTLTVGGQSLTGWTDIEVVRGIEICPSYFIIGMTEKFKEDSAKIVVKPGDDCTVTIGGDLVLTGYVDRVKIRISRGTHSLIVIGRSKSQDAIDCSAEWDTGQIKGSSALEIAKKLVKPYGITVEGEVDTGPPIPQFNLTIGDTPFAIIERIARYRALLVYDKENGNLVLAQAGKDKMGSGLTEGENFQVGESEYSIDQRFSDYEGFMTAVDVLRDLGDAGNLKAKTTDPNVKRHRLKTIIAEDGALGLQQLKPRVDWEAARRFGRSYVIDITADSWRDKKGKLWSPNALVPITSTTLKIPEGTNWLISQVTFRRNNQDGTVAIVRAMPKEAFLPEPIILLPVGVPAELAATP